MSTREELAENLTAYVDGELSELERKRIEEALKADPELAALEQQLRATVTAMKSLPTPEVSPGMKRAVLERLAEPGLLERLGKLFTLPRLVPAVGLAAAAAVAVVVVGARERPVQADADALMVAQNLEVLEDLDLIGLENPDDLDLVASLHQLEATP
jgi:anti-sigma factor RsiW